MEDDLVTVTSIEGTIEFRASRLTWKGQDTFSLSGLERRSHLTSVTLRFGSEDAAKVAAGLLSFRIEEGRSLEAKSGELPVELLATTRKGPFFIIMLLYPVVPFLALLFGIPRDARSALTYGGFVIYVLAIGRLLDAQLKAGPAMAWFRPRRVKAWVSIDNDYVNVRVPERTEGFVPTRVEWTGTDSFVLVSGKTRFRVFFGRPDDATEVLGKIRQIFPNVEVAAV